MKGLLGVMLKCADSSVIVVCFSVTKVGMRVIMSWVVRG